MCFPTDKSKLRSWRSNKRALRLLACVACTASVTVFSAHTAWADVAVYGADGTDGDPGGGGGAAIAAGSGFVSAHGGSGGVGVNDSTGGDGGSASATSYTRGTATASATGGAGGDSTDPINGVGSGRGGDGGLGNAFAFSWDVGSGASATATGSSDVPGDGENSGAGGDGGAASASAFAFSNLGTASASAIVNAGSGGDLGPELPLYGHFTGGSGKPATLVNAAAAFSSVGSISVTQAAYGGNGTGAYPDVNGDIGAAGSAGAANSFLVGIVNSGTLASYSVVAWGGDGASGNSGSSGAGAFSGSKLSTTGGVSLTTSAESIGGWGGNSMVGGDAEASSGAMTKTTAATATATATGGDGGVGYYYIPLPLGNGGAGGSALATAIAVSNSGSVTAGATAAGGDGGSALGGLTNPGSGNAGDATAIAVTVSGNALATASATGGNGGYNPDRSLYGTNGDAVAKAVAISQTGTATAYASAFGGANVIPIYVAKAIAQTGSGQLAQANATVTLGGLVFQSTASSSAGGMILAQTQGTPLLNSGNISSSTLTIGGGTFTQTGGTNTSDNVTAQSDGAYDMQGGTLYVGTLSGTGSFSFNGGTLYAGTVDLSLVNNGGVLASGSPSAIGTTTFTSGNSYTQTSPGAILFKLGATNSYDSVSLTNASATIAGYIGVKSFNGFSPSASQTYTGLTASNVSLSNSAVVVDTTYSKYIFAAGNGTGTLTLSTSGATGPIWNGGSGNWSSNFSGGAPSGVGAKAWLGDASGTPVVTLDADTTIGTLNLANTTGSGYVLSGLHTLTLQQPALSAAITAGAGNNTVSVPLALASNTEVAVLGGAALTISGAVSGAGSLNKSGNGSLILSATNTYAGDTSIAAGTLKLGSGLAIPAAFNVCLQSGGTLDLNGQSVSLKTISGSGLVSNSGTLAIGAANDSDTFAGTISGTGSFTKYGTGTFLLSGTNTYSGGTSVVGGILQGDTNSLQGNIANNASLVFSQDTDGTYGGIVSGSGTLTKNGIGSITLSGTSTYTGTTTIEQGAIAISNMSAVGSGTVTFDGGTLRITADVTTGSGAVARFLSASTIDTGNHTLTVPGYYSGAGDFTKTGNGTMILTGSSFFYSGNTVVADGTLRLAGSSAFNAGLGLDVEPGATFDLNGNSALVGALSGSGSIQLSANMTVGWGGDSSNFLGSLGGTGSLTKTGAGTLFLGGTNSYTGGTTLAGGITIGDSHSLVGNIKDNSTLIFAENDAGTYSGTLSGSGTVTKLGGGTLVLSASNTYKGATSLLDGTLSVSAANNLGNNGANNGLIFSGGTLLTTASFSTNRKVTLGDGGGTIDTSSGSPTFSGLFSGSGSLTKAGSGTLTFSTASNVYSGATNLNGGTLKAGSSNTFAFNSAHVLGSGATLDLNGYDQTIGSLEGSGTALISANLTTGGNNASHTTFSGSLTGTGTLLKVGGGTMRVNSFNLGGLNISGSGAVQLGDVTAAGQTSSNTSFLASAPVIGASAQLDLGDHALIVNYGSDTTHATRDTIRNLLKNGRNATGGSAAWNGNGGITSTYAHNNGNGTNLSIGYGDNEDLSASYTSFGGQTVASSSVLVQLTRGGDCTLDGNVDGADVAIVGTHFGKPNSGQWCFGDFDYNGTCDGGDSAVLGTNYGKTSPVLSPAQMTAEFGRAFTEVFEAAYNGQSSVPEPSGSTVILGILVSPLLRRRRRKTTQRRELR